MHTGQAMLESLVEKALAFYLPAERAALAFSHWRPRRQGKPFSL